MSSEALIRDDWAAIVDRLGGPEALDTGARATKAFQRPRVVSSASDLLRLVLAYCLGEGGLRSTAVWAASVGLADLSNVSLLYRLRQCGDWLAMLVGQALLEAAPPSGRDRLIRIVDATAVPKAGTAARRRNGVWRIHSAFDLPGGRFGFFELTDQREAEALDRIPVVAGEIRLADRAYLKPERLAAVRAAGGDVVVRTGWKSTRWFDRDGRSFDLIALLRARRGNLIDKPIRLAHGDDGLPMRLIGLRKSPEAAEAARAAARRAAQREGSKVSEATLVAAEWVLLVTSLPPDTAPAGEVLDLYRLRWRIEIAFKRLKSLVGLQGPPGIDERSARPYVLAHLLAILLLEPLIEEFEDSPRRALASDPPSTQAS